MNPWYDRFTRMKTYFDQSIPNDEIKREMPGAMDSTTRFDAVKTREILTRKGFKETAIRRFCYRPFDHWLYWESDTKLLDVRNAQNTSPHRPRKSVD